MVGTRGSAEERPLDAADLAFSTANLNGWNAGFHRPGSTLIVVFITDAEDQSQIEAKELMEKLVVLQRGDHRKVLLYGAIVPSSVTGGCSRDHGYPVKLELFLSLSDTAPNNVMSLCDPDFGSRLAEFAVDIVEKASSVMYLSRPPDVNSIRVLFGNMELPRDPYIGWSFDPRLNAISLGKNVDWLSQPAGSEVKVYYNEAEYK